MKLILVTYDTFADEEVMRCLRECGVPGYTKIAAIVGQGETGTKQGTPAWPGTTSVVFTVVADEAAAALQGALTKVRDRHGGNAGLRVFQIPVEGGV